MKKIFLALLLISGLTSINFEAQGNSQQTQNNQQQRRLNLPKINYVVKDKDFTKYDKKRPTTRGQHNQVEIIYFFWYGSDLSWKIDNEMRRWAKEQPYPVRFTPTPVIINNAPYQILGARIFYTLKLLNKEDTLGPLFFTAVQEKHVDMTSLQAITDWFSAHGIPEERFIQTINSNEVKYLTSNTYRNIGIYQVTAMPTMVIDGEYKIMMHSKTSPERIAAITQFMAEKLSQGGPRP